MRTTTEPDYHSLSDLELAARIAAREEAALTSLMQQNNQRLFRVAWSILKDRSEAEDAVQTGYMQAFASIHSFQGASSISTWLMRIVINEALGRRRSARMVWARLRERPAAVADYYRERLMAGSVGCGNPEASLAREQIRQRVESALARLPDKFRKVFVMREIEEMSVAEVSALLGLPVATVKTRHLRAKERLRRELPPEMKDLLTAPLPFAGPDCARLTGRVIQRHCRERMITQFRPA